MTDNTKTYKKYVNFDLNTKAIKQYFHSDSYEFAYRQIEKFLNNNGFEHHQGSGYISKKPLQDTFIYDMVRKMRRELPWVKECVKSFVHTDIVDKFYEDLRFINPQKFKQTKIKTPKPKLVPKTKDPKNKTNKLSR